MHEVVLSREVNETTLRPRACGPTLTQVLLTGRENICLKPKERIRLNVKIKDC